MLIKLKPSRRNERESTAQDKAFNLLEDGAYLVLGLRFLNSNFEPLFEVIDEDGELTAIPGELLELIDCQVSASWQLVKLEQGVALWPSEFLADFFHDDVTEGLPEATSQLRAAYQRLRAESEGIC